MTGGRYSNLYSGKEKEENNNNRDEVKRRQELPCAEDTIAKTNKRKQ